MAEKVAGKVVILGRDFDEDFGPEIDTKIDAKRELSTRDPWLWISLAIFVVGMAYEVIRRVT